MVIGGGIGGLTAAIALGNARHRVDLIEKDPAWGVYGVGILQQSNVVRAMNDLGILDDYLEAGFGFDFVEIAGADGAIQARLPSPRLVPGKPANVGISRPALHKVLGKRAKQAGAAVRLGVTATHFEEHKKGVLVWFSDGSEHAYDLVIGADGIYSDTRAVLFPDVPGARFTGQSGWRYNMPKPPELDALRAYHGQVNAGLTPLSDKLMYMFLTTAEPGNPYYGRDGLAAAMRAKLAGGPPQLVALGQAIADNDEVVYRPFEWLFLDGPWHKGRIVLLGDAAHATTPHLGQGAGMAIEDAVVLADELARATEIEQAFASFRQRRYPRCKYIVEASLAVCRGQLGEAPVVDQAKASAEMFQILAEPL